MGKISECRRSKKCRMSIIGVLMLIVVLMIAFWGKAKLLLWGLLILLAITMGIEGFDYDIDLGKFLKTGSYQESRIQAIKDKNGNTIKLIGSCVKADVNCDNFKTQPEAQKRYDDCMKEIKENNPTIQDPVKLDIYGLDRNHNGIACEALPAVAK